MWVISLLFITPVPLPFQIFILVTWMLCLLFWNNIFTAFICIPYFLKIYWWKNNKTIFKIAIELLQERILQETLIFFLLLCLKFRFKTTSQNSAYLYTAFAIIIMFINGFESKKHNWIEPRYLENKLLFC